MKFSTILLAALSSSSQVNSGLADEELLVLHTAGRRRQEAKLLAQSEQQDKDGISLKEDGEGLWGGSGESCKKNIGDSCNWDSDCCDEMECLGINPFNWECGNTPGTEGEYCDTAYACDKDLSCHKGKCTDYADLLKKGTKGTCKEGSKQGTLKVMTYNLFLINCITSFSNPMPCQQPDVQEKRISKLGPWFEQDDSDVVMFQEVWALHDTIIEAMSEAGFCYYLSPAFEEDGSGLQIFSKFPLEDVDFFDYYDIFGKDSETVWDPEALAVDKGIMYVKVKKDGKVYHIGNTHTLSNSLKERHPTRMEQYREMKDFMAEKTPTAGEFVLYGGDMNEDKYSHKVGSEYYNAMLGELRASEPKIVGEQQYSYDTTKNPIPASFWEGETYKELLDYVLYSNIHAIPESSSCEILIPVWPKDCGGEFDCQISDHFPVKCTFAASTSIQPLLRIE